MKRMIIAAIAAAGLSGCMTFNQNLIKVPDVKPAARPAVIETKVGDFIQKLNGEGVHGGVLANQTQAYAALKLIASRWKDKGLVSEFGPAGELKGTPDYTCTLSGERNEDMSWLGSVLSGLTLMLIPSTASTTTDARVELVDNRTGKSYTAQARNGFTTVTQLLFVTAFPFAPLGTVHSMQDIADSLADQLQMQGALGGKEAR